MRRLLTVKNVMNQICRCRVLDMKKILIAVMGLLKSYL